MVCCGKTLHQHVVNLDLQRSPDLELEHFVHQSLMGCPCVLQPEGHDPVAIGPLQSDKGCLLLIWGVHADMVVPRIHIQEGEQFRGSR